MRPALLAAAMVVALVAAAGSAAAVDSDPEGDAMQDAIDRSGLPPASCAAAWQAYQHARSSGSDEPHALAAALEALPPGERGALLSSYAATHASTPTTTPPNASGAPTSFVAACQEPAGGWSGGRAILARDIPVSDWLAAAGWPEGKPETDPRLVAGATWFPRDRLAVSWLEQGELRIKDDAFTSIELKRGGDVLEVGIACSAMLLGPDVRLVCSILGAQVIADRLGCLLPTCEIVDAAWRARAVNLPAHPQPPNNWMCSVAAGLAEDAQVFAAPMPRGLAATFGKDYVMHPALKEHPDMACIYGWHKADGSVWQSGGSGGGSPHPARYFDYSHTFRLVSRWARLNGASADLAELYRTRPDLVGGPRWGGRPAPARHPLVKEPPT